MVSHRRSPRKSKSRSRRASRRKSRSPSVSPRSRTFVSVGTAYCLKCRKKRQVSNSRIKTARNGRKMMCATCEECGTKVCRFIKG